MKKQRKSLLRQLMKLMTENKENVNVRIDFNSKFDNIRLKFRWFNGGLCREKLQHYKTKNDRANGSFA